MLAAPTVVRTQGWVGGMETPVGPTRPLETEFNTLLSNRQG